MISKKVKWLWSYNIEKTEDWLVEMAQQGWHLMNINKGTRVFTFKKGEKRNVTYRIQYIPQKTYILSETLERHGWSIAVLSGKWCFLLNEQSAIELYPSRVEIIKRNRTHAYISSALAIFQLALHTPIILITFLTLGREDGFLFTDDHMWVLMIFLIEAVILACFASFVFRSYRRFEIREMDATTDKHLIGKKKYTFRPGWMYDLEATKNWLEDLAKKGYELESVKASIFTFRQGKRGNITYECIFEYKVQPSFFATHKELGWRLKFSSSITLLNYSIWAMHYENDEAIPQFSYDKKERRQAIKRAFKMNIGMSIYLILLLSFSLYTNTMSDIEPFFAWSFSGVLRPLLLLFLLYWLYKCIQISLSYRKSINILK